MKEHKCNIVEKEIIIAKINEVTRNVGCWCHKTKNPEVYKDLRHIIMKLEFLEDDLKKLMMEEGL